VFALYGGGVQKNSLIKEVDFKFIEIHVNILGFIYIFNKKKGRCNDE